MNNPIKPIPSTILEIKRESNLEYTFKVATNIKPEHGQFLQLSIPKIGEAPISVSAQGEGWLDFTIRSVGKVTDEIFNKKPGDVLFIRGPYGKGWPLEETFKGKHLVVITGGTGLAPVRSMLNECFVKSLTLIVGFKNEAGIIFKEELNKWQEKFNTFYTLDKDQIEGWNVGFVTDLVEKIPFDSFMGNYEVIIVGPPMMMKFTGEKVAGLGVPDEKIWVFNYTKAKYLVD